MAGVSRSFVRSAISRQRLRPQGSVANGDIGRQPLGLTPPDPSLAALVKLAWQPTLGGQAVPIQPNIQA